MKELTVPVVRSELLPSTGLDSGPNAAVFLTAVPLRLDLYWCSRSASAGTHQHHHHRAFSFPESANQASISPELIGLRTRETEWEDPPLSFGSFGLT